MFLTTYPLVSLTSECASVVMFIFSVHRGQVGPDLPGQVLGWEGQ